MGDIVSIDRRQSLKKDMAWSEMECRWKDFERAADAEDYTEESAMKLAGAAYSLASAMANTPFGKQVAEDIKKRDEDFKNKYRKVFENAPDKPAARIKYFCRVLQRLWQHMEKREQKDRYSLYDDFCSIYMDGVDRTLSDWCRHDRETKKMDDEVLSKYPFFQMKIGEDNMGLLLTESLAKIISIRLEAGFAAKKDFLWEAARLFEIYRGILYVFSGQTDMQEE